MLWCMGEDRWGSARERRHQAHALALLFAAGTTIGYLGLLLPRGPETLVAQTAAAISLGYPTAAILLVLGERTPRWLLNVFLAGGTLIVTVGVYLGRGGPTGTASAVILVWVALYAFGFLSVREGMAHLGFVLTAYAVVLVLQEGPAYPAQWLVVGGTLVVAAVVVGSRNRQIEHLAVTDVLTGLPNRRAWQDLIPRELARARRYGRPLCVAVLDLDGFKQVNDERGHHAGDAVLADVARRLGAAVRKGDVVCRYGGDEFALVMPDTGMEECGGVVDRLRTVMPPQVAFSFGVACWDGEEDAEALLERADRELYRAKAARAVRPERPEPEPV